jgi:hypothetical protein
MSKGQTQAPGWRPRDRRSRGSTYRVVGQHRACPAEPANRGGLHRHNRAVRVGCVVGRGGCSHVDRDYCVAAVQAAERPPQVRERWAVVEEVPAGEPGKELVPDLQWRPRQEVDDGVRGRGAVNGSAPPPFSLVWSIGVAFVGTARMSSFASRSRTAWSFASMFEHPLSASVSTAAATAATRLVNLRTWPLPSCPAAHIIARSALARPTNGSSTQCRHVPRQAPRGEGTAGAKANGARGGCRREAGAGLSGVHAPDRRPLRRVASAGCP